MTRSSVVVVALLALAAAPTGRAGAATDPAPMLAVTDQSFAVAAGEPFTATIAATGLPSAADTELVVTVHSGVTASGGVEAALADPGAAIDRVTVPAGTLEIGTDGSARATIAVPVALGTAIVGDGELQVPAGGLYPIAIGAVSASSALASTVTATFVVDPQADAPNLDVAIVAGIDDPGPWPTDLATPVAELAVLTELSARVDSPLSLQLPPSVASLVSPPPPPAPDGSLLPDVLTDASVPLDVAPESSAVGRADSSATGASTSPDSSSPGLVPPLAESFDGDVLLTRPFIVVDPSSLAAVGETDLLASQLRDGEDVLGATVPFADNSREAWVTGTPISQAGASALRTLGVRLLVVTPSVADSLGVDVDRTVGAAFDVMLANGESMPAVTVSPLGAALSAPSDDASASAAAVGIAAELALAAAAPDGPGAVVLGVPDGSLPDPDVTALVADYLDEIPGIDLTSLSSLTNRVAQDAEGPAVTLPDNAGADLSGRLALIDLQRGDADSAESMLVDPAPARRWESEFDAMLSSAVTDAQVGEHLGVVATEVDTILDAIVAPEPSTLTLTGTANTLRFDIGNTSAYDLNVLVRVRSAKLTFENVDTPALIPAEQTATIAIPAEARSNGSFSVELTVHAPDLHHRLAGPVVFRADVTRLSGVSQVVTAGAIIALASWWYSHLRKTRAARRAAATDGQVDDDGISGPLEP
jgi:hypothetical protein